MIKEKKRIAELIIANKELAFQNEEKEKLVAELIIANKELAFQNDEKEKRAAEFKKLNKAVESSGEVVFMTDKKGVFTFVNPRFTLVYGYGADEVVGKTTPRILKSGKMETKVYKNLWHSLLNGQVVNLEFINKTKDGKSIHIESSANPVFDESGDIIIGFLAIQRDITESKQAEETLAESNKFNLQIIQSANEGIIVYDRNLRYQVWNPFMEKLTGIPASKVIGNQPWDLFHFLEESGVTENLKKVLKGESITSADFLFNIPNSDISGWASDTSAPLRNVKGEIIGVIAIVRNITERKLAEKTIIENNRLGAIGEMASSVAHDFNNSLQAIMGNLELAMFKADLSETTLRYLTTIKTVVSDAANRTQLLQRFGGNKQDKRHYHNINLNTLISEVITQSRPLWKDNVEKKGLYIIIKTEYSDIPNIYGNDGELRSGLYNLLKNSIESMPEGGSIFIETGKKSEGVFVTVTDTGTGMDEETRTRIFQPFYSTKGFDIGRGLGMSGVFSIIKEHGGNIFVKNTAPGKGTTIEIFLPFSKEVETTEKKETISDSKTIMRILWVEDDDAIRENTGTIIEILGHHGDTVSSGQEALEYLEKNEYDIVITDIGMPNMNGWQLADKIKEKFGGKMKVAVASGWGTEIDEATKTEHGVLYVLNKPFKIGELKNLLAEASQLK